MHVCRKYSAKNLALRVTYTGAIAYNLAAAAFFQDRPTVFDSNSVGFKIDRISEPHEAVVAGGNPVRIVCNIQHLLL